MILTPTQLFSKSGELAYECASKATQAWKGPEAGALQAGDGLFSSSRSRVRQAESLAGKPPCAWFAQRLTQTSKEAGDRLNPGAPELSVPWKLTSHSPILTEP